MYPTEQKPQDPVPRAHRRRQRDRLPARGRAALEGPCPITRRCTPGRWSVPILDERLGGDGVGGGVIGRAASACDRCPARAGFPDARLNFAQNLLRRATRDAIVFWARTG